MTATHSVFDASPYQSYVYAYPHKTAYRPFPPRPLAAIWAAEPRHSLFLYLHVPFCTMRCGFCNLFTTPNPKENLVALYLDALRRQAESVKEALPDAQYSQLAIGGGTPTYLDERGLDSLFDIANMMGASAGGIETSPDTITPEKVRLLKARGVERVSIGVQSFVEAETANSGRPQSLVEVDAALTLLTGTFATFNIDLIYGLPGQTVSSWLHSLERALSYKPDELYLYPLYVRPLTGLGRSRKQWDGDRLGCYREARDRLVGEGFEQVSMRMFRRPRSVAARPVYCCQEDGMVGLGCGARSYTRGLHYSLDYAVDARGVKGIIADYLARDAKDFTHAEHGYSLDEDDQRRRYVLQSILNVQGLNVQQYVHRFQSDPVEDFPDLRLFAELGLLMEENDCWTPTAAGLERSDAIGPWCYSERVKRLISEYEPR